MSSFAHISTAEIEDSKKKSPILRTVFHSIIPTVSRKILWGCVLTLSMVFITYLFLSEDGLTKNSGLREKKAILEEETLRLDEENRQVASRIERMTSDNAYLEDEARKKLGLIKSNEVIYKLAEEPDLSEEEISEQLD